MTHVSDEEFEAMVDAAVRAIPERFASHLNNVVFKIDDEPSLAQSQAGGALHGHTLLLGLYEGIPLPERGNGYNGVVPDVITVFKGAHELVANDPDDLRRAVHETVWHEVAHYFGLGHGQIHALES